MSTLTSRARAHDRPTGRISRPFPPAAPPRQAETFAVDVFRPEPASPAATVAGALGRRTDKHLRPGSGSRTVRASRPSTQAKTADRLARSSLSPTPPPTSRVRPRASDVVTGRRGSVTRRSSVQSNLRPPSAGAWRRGETYTLGDDVPRGGRGLWALREQLKDV